MYNNKTVRYTLNNASGVVHYGKIITETIDSYIMIIGGVQTTLRKDQIQILDIILDNSTEIDSTQTLINE